MAVSQLPLVERDQLPSPLAAQVDRLDTLGADTTFHRYVAHSAAAAEFYWGDFYARFFFGGTVPVRTKEVVRLALAALSGCTFCRQGDVDSARVNGLTDEQIDGLLMLDPSSLAPGDRVAFDVATRLSPFGEERPMSAGDWETLRQYFTDDQVAELLLCISVLAGVGRMLSVCGFIPRTCAVPEDSHD